MAGRHFDTQTEALQHLTNEGFAAEAFGPYTHVLRANDQFGEYTLRAAIYRLGPTINTVLLIIDTQEQAEEEYEGREG